MYLVKRSSMTPLDNDIVCPAHLIKTIIGDFAVLLYSIHTLQNKDPTYISYGPTGNIWLSY